LLHAYLVIPSYPKTNKLLGFEKGLFMAVFYRYQWLFNMSALKEAVQTHPYLFEIDIQKLRFMLQYTDSMDLSSVQQTKIN
jgi:hypothetical protein